MITIENFNEKRITVPTNKGVYIFNVSARSDNCYYAELIYYQHYPEKESQEQELIKEEKFTTLKEAIRTIVDWFNAEEERSFVGYSLKTNKLTVGEYNNLLSFTHN